MKFFVLPAVLTVFTGLVRTDSTSKLILLLATVGAFWYAMQAHDRETAIKVIEERAERAAEGRRYRAEADRLERNAARREARAEAKAAKTIEAPAVIAAADEEDEAEWFPFRHGIPPVVTTKPKAFVQREALVKRRPRGFRSIESSEPKIGDLYEGPTCEGYTLPVLRSPGHQSADDVDQVADRDRVSGS